MKFSLRLFLVISLLPAALSSFIIADWVKYENSAGGFSAAFPSMPEESEQELNTALGSLTLKIFNSPAESDSDANIVYAVMYTVYPENTISSSMDAEKMEKFFNGSVNGAVTNVKGKLLSEEKVSIKNFPGRHIKVDYMQGQAVIDMYLYLVNDKNYMLQVIHLPGKEDNSNLKKFIGSFSLN